MKKQGKVDQALDYYHRTIDSDSQYPHPYYNIGILLFFQQKTEEAIRYLQQAVIAEPSDVYSHNNLGNAFRSIGQMERAIHHYRQALEFNPSFDVALNNLAYALFRQGHMDEGAGYFQKALDLRPFWPLMLTGMGRILATHPDSKKRDPLKAIQLVEQAAKLTGYKEPITLNTLAEAYAASGDFCRAVSIAERALEKANEAGNRGLVSQIQNNLDRFRHGMLR
jgi:tetratricopeptide (TPR) repeat protein